jgi:hypothetical protein
VCRSATCGDDVRNGDESDLDCGGSCAGCPDGGVCSTGSDCLSLVCTDDACHPPECDDGVQNGDESDVDCGGACPGCDDAKACTSGTDCGGGRCETGVCCTADSACDCASTSGVTYSFCAGPLDWSGSSSACTADGKRLVVVDSAEENAWLSATASAADLTSLWLGGSDGAVEGEWRWGDGSHFWQGLDVTSGGAAVGGLYSNWIAGEPNNVEGRIVGNCLRMLAGDGVWRDGDCSVARPFVCETEP